MRISHHPHSTIKATSLGAVASGRRNRYVIARTVWIWCPSGSFIRPHRSAATIAEQSRADGSADSGNVAQAEGFMKEHLPPSPAGGALADRIAALLRRHTGAAHRRRPPYAK